MEQEAIEGYRLSPQQEYLWRLCQQHPDAYRTQCALRFEGELDQNLLREVLAQVVEQHEILRTGFRSIPGMNLPLQVILEQGTWSWREVDLHELAEQEQASQLAALERSESQRAFNHEQGEVLSACLARLAPARHVLLLNISPLCADSWALQNLLRELGRRYTARLSGAEAASAEVALEAVQYADFSEWQHELLNTEDSAGRDFWRKQNLSNMPVLKLPLEKDAGEECRPECLTLKSDAQLAPELEALARASDVSLSELLLAAWSSLWWRLTGERELVIGAAVDGGRYKELHQSLGLFTKYLPVPLRFAATSSFQDIIKRVTASYREAYDWQEYYTPGEGRAAEEGLGYEYEEREKTVAGYGALRVEVMSEESCRSRQRVLLQCRYQRATQRLELRLRYDAGCYSAGVIKLLAERFETWLQAVVRAPRAELSKVMLLGEAERGLLREWGTGAALKQVEEFKTLGQMLEQQARERGETAAVVGVEDVLTFSELNARANQLGRYLRQRRVGPEAVVGILLERSTRMVECVCGVWKAGGAYLPLDPGAPPGRLERVIKQAGVRLVVSDQWLTDLVAGTGVEVIEWEAIREAVSEEEVSEPEVAVSGENLAYVIYTSGSTGEPKGVMIEQRSVLHLLGGLRQEVYGKNDDWIARVGVNAPLSFDASVKQLVQVLRGKTLVVIPEELRLEAGPLLNYLAAQKVDVLDCTPAQLRLLRGGETGEVQWPRVLLIGGEAIDAELWQQLDSWDETESINLYGPTEATVDTTWKQINGPKPGIGRPLPQVRIYLLDQLGEQVPIGQAGEVYIGGAGVGRGYLHAAGLTAERFVPDGYGDESGGRLYRTGDLARYTADGELEYVGRTDRQVKLRGFRLELGEVEAALLEHEGVKEAAAMVRRDEAKKEERLVGYVVLHSGAGTRQLAVGEHRLPNGLVIRHQNRSETDYLYEEIFEDQIYLRYGLELPAQACVFDVGANIGMFSLFVSEQSPGARIYAFEPIAEVCESLQHNAELCHGAVKVCRYGLGARSGREEFSYYPQFSARSGLAAYADAADEVELIKQYLRNREALGEAGMESLAEMAEELLEGVFESRREECELRSVSEVIRTEGVETIDLLKIDVQRAELDVLKGVAPEDWRKIRQVSMEVHDKQGDATEGRVKEIGELLEQSGFEVAVEQEERLRGTDRYNLYARQTALGGLQRNGAKPADHVGNGNGNGHGPAPWLKTVDEEGAGLYRLPNQLQVRHQNRNETEFIYDQIFGQRIYLRHGVKLQDGDCVFDVGANIGLFTLFVYEHFPQARVFAFEPMPTTFACLQENVGRYGLPAVLYRCALSNRSGAGRFTFYPKWTASSSLYGDAQAEEAALLTYLRNQGKEVAEYAAQLAAGRYDGEEVECRLERLSEIIAEHNIERIDLLKLDVEKSEWDVLKGIEPKDWQKIRQVVVEVHDLDGRLERMQQLLAEQGFVVEVEQEVGLVGTNIYSLYARRSEAEAAAELSEARSANGNGNGTARLLALGAAAAEVTEAELRSYLRERLPEYMVPQVLVKLERMPLSRHGKTDYQRLPAPVAVAGELKGEAARNEVEEILAGIWSEVLSLVRVGRDENFFELGGHSLLATQVMSRVRKAFGVEVGLRELFERPTVEKLSRSIERELRQGAGVSAPPIEPRERVGELPLSFAQQRLWFIDQLEPGGVVYNVPVAVRLQGSLNQAALAQTLTEVIRRHEVLRTRFDTVAGQAVQVIEAAAPVELVVEELSELEVAEREARVREWAAQEAATPFDLSRGPLLRVKLLRLAEQEHVVLLTMHHIVSDGWSVGVLIKEVGTLYAAYVAGEESPLAELPIQYADFALWQRAYLQGEVLDQQLDYWRRQLAEAPRLLDIPSDHPRPAVRSFRGAVARFELDQELSARLRALSQRESVTLFMLLLAAFKVLLLKYSGQTDIVIGADVANRNRAETENLIGFFVNMLVLRTELSGDPPFRELLQRVREVCLAAYAHQDLPFEKLVEELQPERSLSYAPLFQVVFALQNAPTKDLQLQELTLSAVATESGTAKFDLVFGLLEADGRLVGNMEYNTDLFEAETINRLLGHFQTLLAAVVGDPAQQLSRLPLLTQEEEQQLAEWNNTTREYPREVIHQLFEAQVERTPDAVAVSFGYQEISYRELNDRANQLAHYLQSLGSGPETLVALYLDRSPEMVIAILAVLKAGAAYLPLDLSSPAERVGFMLQDAGASVLVTEHRFLDDVSAPSAVKIVCLDTDQATIAVQSAEPPASGVGPENLAYVIYTSGSSGEPKGTLITQANVTRLLAATHDVFHFDERDVWTLFHSYAFDFSVWELFGPLLSGGRLIVVPYLVSRSPAEFYQLLQREQVTVLNQTPSAFRQLQVVDETEREQLALRLVIFGGEALELESLGGWFARHVERPQLVNMYGITETTVHVTLREVTKTDVEQQVGSVIGRAINDLQLYVLDRGMKPVPVGVPGELYVGGAGLARGYLKRPSLTAEKFVPHPFSARAGERLYRTGDVGRRLNDGSLEYLGRLDEQVKLRGFRIELGEIESVLLRHEQVKEAVVIVKKNESGDKQLVAYLTGEPGLLITELRGALKQQLPEYMIPGAFVVLESLPLTPNGKIDRRLLLETESGRAKEEQETIQPRTPIEEVLLGIWSSVLRLEEIGVAEDFFELGGHSLLATQVMSRVREAFGMEVALRHLFESPTIAGLAQHIEQALKGKSGLQLPPIRPVSRNVDVPLSFSQQRLWFIDQLEPGATLYNIPAAVKLNGELDREALQQTLTELVRRHEVLRTTFHNRDGRAVQVIHPAAPLEMPLTDLSQLPEAEREAEVRRLAGLEAQQVFDLSQGPLFVVKLLRLSEEEHVVLLTMHHIISDGWSIGLVINEVGTLYKAFREGSPSPLADLPIQYADYASWQQEHLSGETLETHLSYWRHQLAGATGLELPPDKQRPAVQTTSGARESFSLPAELSEQLRSLCRREDVTLFMLLLAAFNALLHYYTGQRDVAIGTPIANRNRAETESLIGFFINMLVLRNDLSGDPPFRELLQRARDVCLNAYAHQDVPFEKLVEELQPERSPSRSPLFQIILTLQNAPLGTLELPGLELSAVDSGQETVQYDIALGVRETEQSISATLAYNSDLYEAATIQRLVQLLQTVLRIITEQPEIPLHSLTEMLGEIDKAARLGERKKREESGFAKLKSMKPVPVSVQPESLVNTGYLSGDEALPLIVTPAIEDVDLTNWAGSNRAYIEKQLARNGAILFRGFKLSTAPEFERFAQTITTNLFHDNGEHPRKSVSGNIYTPTFYPPEQKIIWHNENSFNYQWPTKIWFCCVQPAQQGGETPLVDSRRVFAALPASIKEQFIRKGIMYMRNYGRGLGLDWPGVFRTANKAEIEKHCRDAFIDFEWKSENRLCTRAVRPAVVKHPVTGEMTWFNQAQHWHISCLDPLTRESMVSLFAEEDLPRNCYYGDGSRIEDSVMNEILSVYQQLEVSFPWQKGDILMLDNLLTAHARNQFAGERQIMVAMGDMLDYGSVSTTAD